MPPKTQFSYGKSTNFEFVHTSLTLSVIRPTLSIWPVCKGRRTFWSQITSFGLSWVQISRPLELSTGDPDVRRNHSDVHHPDGDLLRQEEGGVGRTRLASWTQLQTQLLFLRTDSHCLVLRRWIVNQPKQACTHACKYPTHRSVCWEQFCWIRILMFIDSQGVDF